MSPKTAATPLELFPAEPVVLPPNTWMIELRGSPPRPNQELRGGFSKDPEVMLRIRNQRLAMQGKARQWKDRTGWALAATGIPREGIARAKVSAIFYRAVLDTADEDGDMGALKHIYDSIAKYIGLPKDSRRYMVRTIPEEQPRPPGQKYNSVRLYIEALPARE